MKMLLFQVILMTCGLLCIVQDRPSNPNITGYLNVEVNRYIILTCSSNSTLAPDYNSELVTLSYTWFVNDTKINEETRETLILYVTRELKYNRYSCTATEDGLESDRSVPVKINPLYGPDRLTITPEPILNINGKLTVREGETIGPYVCTADCNPPCNMTWKIKTSDGFSDGRSMMGTFLKQAVQKNMLLFRCIAHWGENTLKRGFQLDIKDIPQTPINFTGYSFTNRYINLTWISGFNGGYDQFFILYLNEGSTWTEERNLTDPGEGREVQFDHGPLTPGSEYWFRLQSCNKINCSSTPDDVRAVVKGESCASLREKQDGTKPTDAIVVICILSTLFGITCLVVAVIVICKTRYGNKNQKDTNGDQTFQLEEKLMTEHYENVQGTGTCGDVTVQGDVRVQSTDVDCDYTTLERPDHETVYEELKSI
eukprot:XP_011441165.1 PREDICTED: uncharacterized protein LOC105337926 [Crassostrea gigas]